MELDLRNPELFKTPESFYFQVDLHCTGEMMVNVAPWVELYDSGGKKVKSANGKKSTILPGCSSRQAFEVGRIKNGYYKLLLIVDTGTDKVFGGQYELNVR